MRFSCKITLHDKEGNLAHIPSTYRRNFMAFIKECIKNSEWYDLLYGSPKDNKTKPFTFSISLPTNKEKMHRGYLNLTRNQLHFHFTSCNQELINALYNGILYNSPTYHIFPQYTNHVSNFYIHKPIHFDQEEMVFRTISPVLVRNFNKRKGQGFLEPTHPDFKENLKRSMWAMAKSLKKHTISTKDISIETVKIRTSIVPLYGGEIGVSGIFKINAPTDILQLLYDVGLGAKRAQGFGMLEVIG